MHHTEEACKLWAMPKKGYKQTPEHIANNRGRFKPRSEEHKKKLSDSLKGWRNPIIIPPMPERTHEVAWAAGLFEGEGCISKQSGATKRCVRLNIDSTDLDVLERLPRIFTVGTITGPTCIANRKPIWHYNINKQGDILMVMELIGPFLGKRRMARWLELKTLAQLDDL